MKAKKDPKIFLEHILESIGEIENNIEGISEVEFSKSITIQDATVRRLEIIGEAVRNIPDSFRKKHAKVPWKKSLDCVTFSFMSILAWTWNWFGKSPTMTFQNLKSKLLNFSKNFRIKIGNFR